MKIFTTGSTGHLTQEIFVNAKLSRDQHALAKFIFLGNPDDTVPPNPNCINFNSRCASDLSRFPWFDRPGVIIAVGQQDNDLTFGLGSPQSIDSQRQAITDGKTKVPLLGVLLSAGLGLLFLLPFPSWGKLVSVVTGATVLMYAGAPLALGALRRTEPNTVRTYRLPAAKVLAPVAFVAATLVVYWSGWQTISTLMIVLLLGYGLMGLARAFKLDDDPPAIDWVAGWWLFPYLIGVSTISYLGNFGPGGILGGVGPFRDVLVGGHGRLPLWIDMAVLSGFSLIVYAGALAQATRGRALSVRGTHPR